MVPSIVLNVFSLVSLAFDKWKRKTGPNCLESALVYGSFKDMKLRWADPLNKSRVRT